VYWWSSRYTRRFGGTSGWGRYPRRRPGVSKWRETEGQRRQPGRVFGREAHPRVAREREIEGQRDAVAVLHRPNLVPAVGVERDQDEVARRATAKRPLATVVVDDGGTTAERGRQQHHQRADHVVRLLGVLVRGEELAGLVHEQVVKLRAQRPALGQPQGVADLREVWLERPLPVAPVDLHSTLGDLPGVPNAAVEQRPFALAELRGPSDGAQRSRRLLRDGKRDGPDALHLQAEGVRLHAAARRERPGRAQLREPRCDLVRGVHRLVHGAALRGERAPSQAPGRTTAAVSRPTDRTRGRHDLAIVVVHHTRKRRTGARTRPAIGRPRSAPDGRAVLERRVARDPRAGADRAPRIVETEPPVLEGPVRPLTSMLSSSSEQPSGQERPGRPLPRDPTPGQTPGSNHP
jgi:hypothetical protein